MSENLTNTERQELVRIQNLVKYYPVKGGVFRREVAQVKAVDDVSFSISKGETLGLVGESGCGKSTVAFGVVNFLDRNGRIDNGSILFQGQELRGRSQKDLRLLRGDQISMVYHPL